MSFTIQEVAQLLRQAKENKKPYVFFTGAGCSISADVPSATGLIEEIRSQFPIQVKNIDHEKDQYNYGKYMSVLDKDERRRLLKPHILDNKNINWAHIALACLMQAGFVERVLTFNFDSILSRACNLLGLYPSIYDFATANPHLYHLINDPSIVHLHGQGTGFVQLNTKEETQKHTEHLGDFIASTLNSNPSLFIGYSGNADEFFPLLKEKYSEQHRLIWTGRKNNIDNIEAQSVKEFLKENNNLTHYIGNIDADKFLIELAKELECFPPELFLNPYTFLNNQLQLIQPYPLEDGLDVLENLSNYLQEQAKEPLIDSLYTAFIHKYQTKESTSALTEEDIDQIMWAYTKQAQLLFSEKNHQDSFDLYEKALTIKNDHTGCVINYALCLSNAAESKKDVSLFVKSLNLFEKIYAEGFKEPFVLGQHALNMHKKAAIEKDEKLFLLAFEKFEEALRTDQKNIDNLGNYGNALYEYAILKNEPSFFELASEQHRKALQIEPDHNKHQTSYIINLLHLYHFKPTQETLDTAFKFITNQLISKPNDTYNLACYYCLTKQFDLAKQNILHAEQHNTLPQNPYQHLLEDKDLTNIKNESWFIELLDRLKAKEENSEAA